MSCKSVKKDKKRARNEDEYCILIAKKLATSPGFSYYNSAVLFGKGSTHFENASILLGSTGTYDFLSIQ